MMEIDRPFQVSLTGLLFDCTWWPGGGAIRNVSKYTPLNWYTHRARSKTPFFFPEVVNERKNHSSEGWLSLKLLFLWRHCGVNNSLIFVSSNSGGDFFFRVSSMFYIYFF